MISRVLAISLIFLIACQSKPEKDEILRHVGDITFDPEIDNVDFEICNENRIYQYYNFSNAIMYEGEKATLVREIHNEFEVTDADDNGYISVRFVVNCKGQTGRFRVTTMNDDYQEIQLSTALTNQLLEIVKSRKGWLKGESRGKKRDYYQYLTFKIKNGQLIDIMP
ncbi:MAG: hypothetical protein AAFQ94_19605 [Bacteroidota bacterium]